MKSLFQTHKVLKTIVFSALILILVSVSAIAAAKLLKESDPIPKGDSYGAYVDNSKNKIAQRTIEIDSNKIQLSYLNTENLKEQPVSKRADTYGTYDVYVDDDQTEYLFLLNSDLFCGFKMIELGMPTVQADAIPQEKALKTASDFLRKHRSNYSDYQLLSCEYRELDGYYDIQYYLPVCGYKSDDIMRIWISAAGKITAFSEFNYNRYGDLMVDSDKYVKAEAKLNQAIMKSANYASASVANSYISIDDEGNAVLIMEVDYTIPSGEAAIVKRELFVQPIT